MTTRTGLIPSVRKIISIELETPTTLEFTNLSVPAPYVLRPFAGVYNPFPYGCSILCNHPADYEAKDIVKRAKDAWTTEGKALLTVEEIETIRSNYLQSKCEQIRISTEHGDDRVPEELFRKYTDTDSRPLTPAPTLASVITRGSHAQQVRRCVTPDPVSTLHTGERTMLVLDLRRSHSQDTLSCQTGPQGTESGTTVLQHLPTGVRNNTARTGSSVGSTPASKKKSKLTNRKKQLNTPLSQTTITIETPPNSTDKDAGHKLQIQVLNNVKGLTVPDQGSHIESPADSLAGSSSGDQDVVKRRGKRKKGKKSGRSGTKEGEKEFQGIPDPGETQVSALGNESRAGSTRPSLTPGGNQSGDDILENGCDVTDGIKQQPPSFLDPDLLKLLQRQLDQEAVDAEFDPRRKRALEEALKSKLSVKVKQGEEMIQLKKELSLPESNPEKWLHIPRVFTRQSARFELPMDSRTLNQITPLEYAQNYVFASTERRVLYNHVFNLHRVEVEEEEEEDGETEKEEQVETERILLGKNMAVALGEIMGRQLTADESNNFQSLIGWNDTDLIDFRTFVGVGAICERLMGSQFCSKMPSHEEDPRFEVERADFESLDRKLIYLKPDKRVVYILKGIRDF